MLRLYGSKDYFVRRAFAFPASANRHKEETKRGGDRNAVGARSPPKGIRFRSERGGVDSTCHSKLWDLWDFPYSIDGEWGGLLSDDYWHRRFNDWVDRYGALLRKVCLRRVGAREELADELLHETFRVAWEKRESFQGNDDEALKWLSRISYNLAPGVWRRNRSMEPLEGVFAERFLVANRPNEGLEAAELARLRACFSALAAVDREILVCRFGLRRDSSTALSLGELTWSEIAGVLEDEFKTSFAADQVRMRAKRALVKLRACLEKHGILGTN